MSLRRYFACFFVVYPFFRQSLRSRVCRGLSLTPHFRESPASIRPRITLVPQGVELFFFATRVYKETVKLGVGVSYTLTQRHYNMQFIINRQTYH